MDTKAISLLPAIDKVLPGLIARNDSFPQFSRSEWIYADEGKVYLRAGMRILGPGSEGLAKVIDLATLELFEDFQGKGIFSAVLAHLEQHAARNERALFVENVLNEKIDGALRRRGYSVRGEDPSCSYWKKPGELQATPPKARKRRFP